MTLKDVTQLVHVMLNYLALIYPFTFKCQDFLHFDAFNVTIDGTLILRQ